MVNMFAKAVLCAADQLRYKFEMEYLPMILHSARVQEAFQFHQQLLSALRRHTIQQGFQAEGH